MNDRIRLVLKGFGRLSTEEQRELIDELNRYYASRDEPSRRNIKKRWDEAVDLGPVDRGCPCCGR